MPSQKWANHFITKAALPNDEINFDISKREIDVDENVNPDYILNSVLRIETTTFYYKITRNDDTL